ncbi:MAG: 3-dehydroquinate synthase, partial [Parasporobacterium sp.]|nr:3-dehydroquinate synthase [Parasporobacterium sp.]
MNNLEKARAEISAVDAEIAALFERRMTACREVAAFKKETGKPIKDEAREAELIEKNSALINDPELKPFYVDFLKNTMDISCRFQSMLISEERGCSCKESTGACTETGAINSSPAALNNNTVFIGRGLLDRAGEILNLNRKALIVTDDGVPAAYAKAIAALCAEPFIITIPQGEASKNFNHFKMLLSGMLNHSFTRTDCVIAIGGGMVGDLSGFAAACYMRGIDFYNIPTTLLSQLDSSVGGKTAIDFEAVKNTIGSFYPPAKVIIDPDVLDTLPERQFSSGLAEAIKIGAIMDKEMFELIEGAENIKSVLPEIIRRGVENKLKVVEADPTEKGLRRILNFGHTIGHGIESASNGEMLHGEAVAVGMVYMCSEPVRE